MYKKSHSQIYRYVIKASQCRSLCVKLECLKCQSDIICLCDKFVSNISHMKHVKINVNMTIVNENEYRLTVKLIIT